MQISARAVPVPHPHTARACASAVLWQTLRHRNFSLYTASRRAAQILFSVLLPWSFILATALFLGQQGIVRQVKSRPTHTCVRLVLRGTFVRCPWRSMRRNPNASMTKALKITLKTWEHDPPLYQCALTHSSRTWKSMTTQWIRPFTR